MWLEGYPFEVSGTLHMSAREAWEQFGYRMKERAVEITFVKHRNGVFIRSCMPHCRIRTEKQRVKEENFRVITKIGSEYLLDIVKPIWDKEAEGKKYTGYNLFVGVNMGLVGVSSLWERLCISIRDIEQPDVE